MTEVVAVAAVGRNGVIGADQDIPWRIPADWQRFKAMTTGHVLIMGRRTHDSIGRPLPGRTTIVVTRDGRRRTGVQVAPDLPEAFAAAEALHPEVIFVVGGGEVYRAAWHRLDRLEITEVDLAPDGDVTFPTIDPQDWRETSREDRDGFSFVSYSRVQERY